MTIGNGGGAHIDPNDDKARVNIILFLPNLPENYCPGKFLLLNDRIYHHTAPYTALISSGAMPHMPVGPQEYNDESIKYEAAAVTPEPDLDLPKRRASFVAYPQIIAMRDAPRNLKPIMRSIEENAQVMCGGLRGLQTYQARLEAWEMHINFKARGLEVDEAEGERLVEQVQNKFSFTENYELQRPAAALIKETLLSTGEIPTLSVSREEFIDKYVFCGSKMGKGRMANPDIVDGKTGDIIRKAFQFDDLPPDKAKALLVHEPEDKRDVNNDKEIPRRMTRSSTKAAEDNAKKDTEKMADKEENIISEFLEKDGKRGHEDDEEGSSTSRIKKNDE